MITLTEIDGNSIEIQVSDIRRYRATDLPKDGTWIEMNSGTEFRVTQSFETVDKLVESSTEL